MKSRNYDIVYVPMKYYFGQATSSHRSINSPPFTLNTFW